ncbi:UNVERIFIED_CONTAM: DNA-directed RNA polymerase V subunit [Sesamum radiatum]|uniref:DNA-directed RNA polymerase V subunit n=1 Tax=Sesamum radiatum TaxID=300843 RepID=A0AAW2V9H9_SESRA
MSVDAVLKVGVENLASDMLSYIGNKVYTLEGVVVIKYLDDALGFIRYLVLSQEMVSRVLKEMEDSSALTTFEAKIKGIKFGLATRQEICKASISDCPISHASQLSNPFLGLPLETGKCESCGTAEAGQCEGMQIYSSCFLLMEEEKMYILYKDRYFT